jgi:hypothetical protein
MGMFAVSHIVCIFIGAHRLVCHGSRRRLWSWTFEQYWNCEDYGGLSLRANVLCVVRWIWAFWELRVNVVVWIWTNCSPKGSDIECLAQLVDSITERRLAHEGFNFANGWIPWWIPKMIALLGGGVKLEELGHLGHALEWYNLSQEPSCLSASLCHALLPWCSASPQTQSNRSSQPWTEIRSQSKSFLH